MKTNVIKKLTALLLIAISSVLLTCCKNNMQNQTFELKATIISVDEKILVNVIESDYAFGEYLVITSLNTKFIDVNGENISKTNLNVNDTIIITYDGQVMMSYPPQIVASKITIIN